MAQSLICYRDMFDLRILSARIAVAVNILSPQSQRLLKTGRTGLALITILALAGPILRSNPALAEDGRYAILNARIRSLEARTKIPIAGPKFGRVLESSFERVSRREGVWHGTVHGNGEIKLILEIIRKGLVHSSHYMGHVFLNPSKRPTTFAYKFLVPMDRDWSWRITAAVPE